MADIHSKETRSRNMAAVKNKNTKPELFVRKELHRRGFRYSLHPKNISGKPDLYLKKYKTAIFINGCFWHGHDCNKGKLPKSNINFWKAKIEGNKTRDITTYDILKKQGMHIIVIWECSLKIGQNELIDTLVHDILSNTAKELITYH